MMTDMERDLVQVLGFELVHDGQHNPDRFHSPPEDVRSFIRRYQKGGLEVTFRYDLRQKTGDIVRFEWHGGKGNFRLDNRRHKNGRDNFVMEGIKH